MFKDKATVLVKAGKGGNGIVAFRREKYVPLGGPAGGDGGKGGSVIFIADHQLNTLLDFSYQRHLIAKDGGNGLSKNKYGKDGDDLILKVPVGTQVFLKETNELLYDFTYSGQKEIVAKGGKGGRGNSSFKTHNNPAPKFAENGDLGESFEFNLELKVLADVGLIGLPNAGKSTLISVLSNAKPEIANYPFTTLKPHLGLVYLESEKSFVMADLPGLIEGASKGAGLGFEFLKHIERCRVLLHVVSMDKYDNPEPYESFLKINEELRKYNEELLNRPMLICAAKMDTDGSNQQLSNFKSKLKDQQIFEVSSILKTGLNELKYHLFESVISAPEMIAPVIHKTYKLRHETPFFIIEKASDGIYEVTGDGLFEVFNRIDFNNEESVRRFGQQLRSYGLDQALREKGVKYGDEVRIFGYLFEMRE